MDYYLKEFRKLQEEFHEVMHDYPLFSETLEDIEEHNIKDINELLEKNDEFYLKKAIAELKKLIEYVKSISTNITRQYEKFDKLAQVWEKIVISGVSEQQLNEINAKVRKANLLIEKHDIEALVEANQIMEELIKDNQ